MFRCRNNELEELNRRYHGDQFECMILYGRRRVGKTALINEFCKDKPTIYFPALKDTIQGNLEALSAAIQSYKDPESESFPQYSSFQDAFREIGRLSQKDRIVFVIDEYPYLAKAEPSISSRLQHLIDLDWTKGRMFLILCGSSVSFMEDEVLSYESPLYGRRTGQIRLMPLDYRESSLFYENLPLESKAEIYGITGGIPLYLNKLDIREDLDQALLQNYFNPTSYLFEEPENLLKQELREPASYNAIIKVIAGGATKLSEISDRSGIEKSSCTAYIQTLIELGILKKETPVGQKEGRKSLLKINDPFFRFWYRFVPRNLGAISTGRIRQTYERSVKDYLHEYMGSIFEDMCAQYLMKYAEELPVNLNSVGRWWGTDPVQKKEIEIDLVGEPVQELMDQPTEYLLGSCKFRSRPAGVRDLKELEEYGRVFAPGARFHYYVFSAFGFTEELQALEEKENLRLIRLEDMY